MDIFDEIIRCLGEEAGPDGPLFIRKRDLAEFMADPVKKPAPAPAAAAGPNPVTPQGAAKKPAPAPAVPETPATQPLPDVSGFDMAKLHDAAMCCRACRLAATRRNVVFSDGSGESGLMFIGEGPGADEDAQGVPFVGKAGQLLSRMIAAMKFDRKKVYIANIVKCRPPGNRNPEEDEAALCLPFLVRQIELVKPRVLVILGSVPLRYLMNMTGIMRIRGCWLDYHGIPVMPTFHPAYLLRNPDAKRDAWNDLQLVMAKMKE